MMKPLTKLLALTLALLMTMSLLAACGSDGDKSGDADSVTTAPEENESDAVASTWGEISVIVPKGMHMTGGNGTLDPEDPKTAWLYDDENAMHYVKISIVDSEDAAIQNIEMTRSANEAYDPATASYMGENTTWTGVSYYYNELPCCSIYSKIGDKVFMIMSYGFDLITDFRMSTILNSLS